MKKITQFMLMVLGLFHCGELNSMAATDLGVLPGKVYRAALKKELIADTMAIKPGMGNLFFSNKFSNEIKIPALWKSPELAGVIENDTTLVPVYIARYKDENGVYKYVLDSNSDGT
jgi:hypothetical protein